MQLSIVLGVFEGAQHDMLNDPDWVCALLRESVNAAQFSLLGMQVHKFEPQGVTGLALVGESHVAVHTWPEEGVLFVDVASCTTIEAGHACLRAIAALLPGVRLSVRETRYQGPRSDGVSGLEHVPLQAAP